MLAGLNFLWPVSGPVQHSSSSYVVILPHNAAELCTSSRGSQCSLARMNNVVLLRRLVQGCIACCLLPAAWLPAWRWCERRVWISLRDLYKYVVLECSRDLCRVHERRSVNVRNVKVVWGIPLVNFRGKRHLERYRWKGNIKMNVAELNCEFRYRI